jgi:hypothetical protein
VAKSPRSYAATAGATSPGGAITAPATVVAAITDAAIRDEATQRSEAMATPFGTRQRTSGAWSPAKANSHYRSTDYDLSRTRLAVAD